MRATRWACAAAAGVLTMASAAGAQTAIIAGRTLMPDGTLAEGKAVVIEGGQIREVIDAASLDERRYREVIRRPDAVLSPGLIDASSAIGVAGANVESVRSIDLPPRVADAFDGSSEDVRRALEGGITAAWLMPAPTTLVAGRAELVRLGAGAVEGSGAMALALGDWALDVDREPSSRAGALYMFREELGREDSAMRRALSQRPRVVVRCERGVDVRAMLALMREHTLGGVIVHDADLVDVAGQIAADGAGLVVGPWGPGTSRRTLAGAAALARSGAKVAFRGGLPDRAPEGLRLTAAMAVRSGLDAATARRGLTSAAAELAGAGDRVGSIQPGRAADLVLFSDDPLRLDARAVAVWVGGRMVFAQSSGGDDAW